MPPGFDHIIEALEKHPHLIEKNDLISQGNLSILSGSPRSPLIKKGRTPIIANASSFKSLNNSSVKKQQRPESIFSINMQSKIKK